MKTKIVKLVIELNMFNNEPNNNQPPSRQIYATRIYVFLLITSLIILSTYTLLSRSINRRTLLNPSEFEYLHLEQEHSDTLSCPCTSINMSYSTFITSTPHYHQLCSSDLITSQWLEYSLSAMRNASYIYDYRINAAVQFKTLTFLCESAQQTVNDALDSFLQTELVGSQVIQRKLFESQMYALIQEWNSTTLNQFVRAIQLIRNTTHSNQLLNRLNIYIFPNNNATVALISPRDYRGCPCVFSRTCTANMGIYVYDTTIDDAILIYSVPNFFVGCYLVDALFMSTLECFYNETCMIELDRYLNSSMRQSIPFPVLSATLNPPDETVESIVNRLMLDSWLSSVNFSNYYKTCAPSACTFEYKGRNDLFSAITTIIGLFGGLSLGYNLIILMGLQIMEEFMNGLSVVALLQLRRRLFSFDNDEKRRHRLHVLLVIVTLSSLYSTVTFTPKLIKIETQKPSLSDYEQLVDRYSGSVQCACSQISIKYQSFLELQARFHPACNDGFMSRYWFFVWSNGALIYSLVSRDYVYSGSGQVVAIMSLCDLSQQVVTDSFRQLLSSDFISAQLLSSDLLYQRMRKMIDDFLVTIPKSTINTLSLIRETTSANMIMNTLSNNWVFTGDNVFDNWAARTRPVIYPGCTCGLSAQCTDSILGVRFGCYVIEALWQTTFEAFYDSRRLGLNLSFPTLNISEHPTRFGINATIGSVVNELMVEEFSKNFSYANYFAECAPSLCISSYTDRSRVFNGIMMLISLYGGLVIICQLMAMIVVKLLRRQQNNNIYPIIQ